MYICGSPLLCTDQKITTKADYNSMIDPTGTIHAKEPVKPALAKFGLTLPLISQ